MTNINLIRKTITGAENVVVDQFGSSTVAFFANLPKNALITSVIVNGEHLNDYAAREYGVTVEYPRELYAEDKRVVAVLRSIYDANPIINAALSYTIESFVVEYILTAIAEV